MNRKLCAPADKAQSWESIDWKKAEAYVKKLQMRIVKAQKGGHYNKVKSLQWLLTHSFYAKALAVKRVTSNTKGREKLVKIWNNQKRCCPVCGERITSETGFKTHFSTENNRKWPAIMVHPWCHRNLHEPGYLI